MLNIKNITNWTATENILGRKEMLHVRFYMIKKFKWPFKHFISLNSLDPYYKILKLIKGSLVSDGFQLIILQYQKESSQRKVIYYKSYIVYTLWF